MPSTSTISASSYFCTVLEHRVTWKGKGEKLLWKASPLSTWWEKEAMRRSPTTKVDSRCRFGCVDFYILSCRVKTCCFQRLGEKSNGFLSTIMLPISEAFYQRSHSPAQEEKWPEKNNITETLITVIWIVPFTSRLYELCKTQYNDKTLQWNFSYIKINGNNHVSSRKMV